MCVVFSCFLLLAIFGARIRRALFCPVLPGAGKPRVGFGFGTWQPWLPNQQLQQLDDLDFAEMNNFPYRSRSAYKDNTFRMRLFHAVLISVPGQQIQLC